ncbi:MAG: response regulator [Nitrospirota bacterium]
MENSSRNNILVVDDDPVLLESTSLLLGREGYSVTSCGSAHNAIAKVRENNIDVVLSDIRMPEVSGITLLEEIHKINPGLPVILITAYAELDTAVNAIKKGAFDFLIKPTPPDYLLHSVQKAFEHINLIKLNKNYKLYLEDLVAERTQTLAKEVSEHMRTEEALRLSESHIRHLSERLQEVEKTERKELARELHDRVGQNLSALNINLGIIRGMAASAPGGENILSHIDESMALVEEVGAQIRDVMNDLRPDLLDSYGLVSALKWYGERFSKRTGISVAVKADERTPRLPEKAESTLFLIAKEALNNIAKHAAAGEAALTIESKEGLVLMTIKDDGKGFDISSVQKGGKEPGWGLLIMQERAQSIGGQLHIESGAGTGTTMTVTVKV